MSPINHCGTECFASVHVTRQRKMPAFARRVDCGYGATRGDHQTKRILNISKTQLEYENACLVAGRPSCSGTLRLHGTCGGSFRNFDRRVVTLFAPTRLGVAYLFYPHAVSRMKPGPAPQSMVAITATVGLSFDRRTVAGKKQHAYLNRGACVL